MTKQKNTSRSTEEPSKLLKAYAAAAGTPTDIASQDPIFGNADLLVHQWRRELGGEKSSEALLMGIRIRRIGMLLDKLIMQACEGIEIKLHEFILLMALRRIGEPYSLRPSDILKMHSVTSGTATYRLDQLAKRDLVQRVPDPNDRRSYLIGLTSRGRAIVDEVLENMRQAFDEQLKPFNQIPEGFAALEAGLRLFETCLLRPRS